MKIQILPALCLVLGLVIAPRLRAGDDIPRPPSSLLHNRYLELRVAHPDSHSGFYRGTRYDPSGMILMARVGENTFFAPPAQAETSGRTPSNLPAGFTFEFSPADPPDYLRAFEGQPFLKIGVGVLAKGELVAYQPDQPYALLEGGTWRTFVDKESLEFEHRLDHDSGWGYDYQKKLILLKNESGFRIICRLTNTGKREIDTLVDLHSLIQLPKGTAGPGLRVITPFSPLIPNQPGSILLDGLQITLAGRPTHEPLKFELEGYAGVSDQKIGILSSDLDSGIEVHAQTPAQKICLTIDRDRISPAFTFPIRLKSGDVTVWELTCRFISKVPPEKAAAFQLAPEK